MRFSTLRLVASRTTIVTCVLVAVAVGASVGYAVHAKVRHDFLVEMRHEADTLLALTNSYVSTYANILPAHAIADAPVPATFRAQAGEAFNASLPDADRFSAWMVGTSQRWIGTPPRDPDMFEQLEKMEHQYDPQPSQRIIRAKNGQHLLRNVFPSKASSAACAACHNRLEPELPALEIGDLLGAYVIDRNIEGALSEDRRLGTIIGVLVTIVLLLGSWMFLQNKALQRQSRKLIRLSEIDPLTGCLNRRALRTRFAALVDCVNAGMAVLEIDLDHFKEINDLHGHDAGDRVLTTLTELVTSVLRTQDMFARMGGEEFLVVLPGVTHATAYRIANRICRTVASHHFDSSARPIRTTVSIGVAVAETGGDWSLEHWMKVADEQLYLAKAAGRNQVAIDYVAEHQPLDRAMNPAPS